MKRTAEELNKGKETVYFENGTYITDPYYIDYNQGLGPQIAGGTIFDTSGKIIGHADPPGPMGEQGKPGQKHNKNV
jgi:hypothetical protein